VLFPVPEPAPQAQNARDAPLSSPDLSTSGFVADLSDRNNAVRIQVRLVELGYLQDAADGRWGAKSRAALRAFKQANGFSADDHWDAFTADQLFSGDALRAPSNTLDPLR
jgi:peptidoglycan hydrolase-like protein with peptidoglycan-binding domain